MTLGLVAGVLTLNALVLGLGLLLLRPIVGSRTLPTWISFAGLAWFLGAASLGVALHLAVLTGARLSAAVAVGAAALLAAVAVALRDRWGMRLGSPKPRVDHSRAARLAPILAGCLLAYGLLLVAAAFRAPPFLDDTLTMWIPKGLALTAHGLDPRVFTPAGGEAAFPHPDYPLWWSILLSLDMQLVGRTDLNTATAQSAIAVTALFAAAARMLWGHVRPWVLWTGLLALALAPELTRQTQSGGADLALAALLTLTLGCLLSWLVHGEAAYLLLAYPVASAALLTKSEGLPQLVLFTLVLTLVAIRHRPIGQVLKGWIPVAGALATAVPWQVWVRSHGADSLSDIRIGDALSPAYLASRTERVGPAADVLLFHLTNPNEWFLVVPLAIVLSVYAASRTRRSLLLAPPALLGAGYAFWIWANWADPLDLAYRLGTSAYRIVDPMVIAAAISLPILGEVAIRRGAFAIPAIPRVPVGTRPAVVLSAIAALVAVCGAALGHPLAAVGFGLSIPLAYRLAGVPGVFAWCAAATALGSTAIPAVRDAGQDLRWLALAALAFWPVVMPRSEPLRILPGAIAGFAGGLTAWALFSVTWSAVPDLSAQRALGFGALLWIAFVSAPYAISTEPDRRLFLSSLGALGVAGAVLALVLGIVAPETSRPLGPLRGWFENSNPMGYWTASVVPAILLTAPRRWRGPALVVVAAVVVWSASRAALLLFVVLVVVWLPASASLRWKIIGATALTALLLMASPLREVVSDTALGKFTNTEGGTVRALTGARNEAWSVSWELASRARVEGYGFGAGDRLFALTGVDQRFRFYQGDNSGSQVLATLLEVGLVGLALTVALLTVAGRAALRLERSPTRRALLMVASGIVAVSLVESFLTSPGSPFAVLGWLTLGLAGARSVDSRTH